MLITTIRKLFFKILPPSLYLIAIENEKINKCLKQVSIGEKSNFHPEASVLNLTKDISKIDIGENTHIRGEIITWPYAKELRIGDNCFLGINSTIRCGNRIIIGNNVLIAHNVNIIDSNSHEIDSYERAEGFKMLIKEGHPKSEGNVITKPIIIEDNVWISNNVIILKGVKIGKGAIIGAGSVVTKNVESFTFVAGNPAIKIKNLSEKNNKNNKEN
jgi:acetyltransferase-like isoleucine patch superfamily enzyme